MTQPRFIHLLAAYFSFVVIQVGTATAQCAGNRVLHTSGTQQVGCVDVTVTSDGSIGSLTPAPCFYGPFLIGPSDNGSYTLSFSAPIQGVMLDVQTLDNHNGETEEMLVDVDGSFYPITSPGTGDGCWGAAIVWPPGTIRGPVGGVGSARDIYISGPINTLKITNNWVSGSPVGFSVSVYVCCTSCETEAGQINADPIEICLTEPVVLPPTVQSFLEPDDLLQYVLYSGLNNLPNSILATSDTPQFSFDPAIMVAGTPYYIAAIAGNNLGGNVDLNDPCLDVSNVIEVTWMPMPVVTFFSAETCLNPGDCYSIDINFLGTPPFQFTGQVVIGNTVVSTFGGTYTTMSTAQIVCVPANAPLGPITIEEVSLSDAFCICN